MVKKTIQKLKLILVSIIVSMYSVTWVIKEKDITKTCHVLDYEVSVICQRIYGLYT